MLKFNSEDYGLLVIKPGFIQHAADIGVDIARLGLEIVGSAIIKPCPEYANLIYPKLMAENGVPARNIMGYMGNPENEEMMLLVVKGKDAMQLLNSIKSHIKTTYGEEPPSVTRNVVHMPEHVEEMVANAIAFLQLREAGKADFSALTHGLLKQIASSQKEIEPGRL